MCARKLIIFKHNSKLGNAPAHKLFEFVTVKAKDTSNPPRSFNDYEVVVNKAVPAGVDIIEKI
jgi:CRISPR-associated protein Csd2